MLRARRSPRESATTISSPVDPGRDVPSSPRAEALDSDAPLLVPARAIPAARPPFPVFGCLAPLLGAAVLWAVLQSPLALVFALLSPVVALASVLDGTVSTRRARRKEDISLGGLRRAFVQRVDVMHERERELLDRDVPAAAHCLAAVLGPRVADVASMRVRLGTASGRSSIRVEGGSGDDEDAHRLRSYAVVLRDAPITAPAPARIAVVGPRRLAESVARGFVVQLAAAIPAHAVSFVLDGAEESESMSWVGALPHEGPEVVALGSPSGRVRATTGAFVLVSTSLDRVPSEATVVLVVDPARGVTVFRHPDGSVGRAIRAEFVSSEQVWVFADRLSARVRASGRLPHRLPPYVAADELEPPRGSAGDSTLAASVGVTADGSTFTLDLVASGPHAVVGGTTGSGKSELLVTWVAAMAAVHSPSEFTVLLVDFKGGSAFDGLTALPHCVGLITDLDPTGALRALSSLNAEIRHRERVLRDQGARDIGDPALSERLARLVIVVDEFAAMLNGFPSLHDVFADIAARGRSLGMHLILCTQRPSGVVRDSLLANCELRLSLRVNNPSDSTALIGTPAAAKLPATLRGRCYVAVGGEPPVLVQVAHTEASGAVEGGQVVSPAVR